MTGLLRPSFAQTGIGCKTGPWQMASAIRQSGDICTLRAESILLSSRHSCPLVFAATHDNRAVHTGEGSGSGRRSAIRRRVSSMRICKLMCTNDCLRPLAVYCKVSQLACNSGGKPTWPGHHHTDEIDPGSQRLFKGEGDIFKRNAGNLRSPDFA